MAVPEPLRERAPIDTLTSENPQPFAAQPVPAEAVPPATIASFERITGVDLGYVPVLRSPAVDDDARRRGARAYTSGGVVRLHGDAGPLEAMEAQALLGHELTHVLQQRSLGDAADEERTAGEALEAEALALERVFLEDPHTHPPGSLAAIGRVHATRAWTPDEGFVLESFGSADPGQPPPPETTVQRASTDRPQPQVPAPATPTGGPSILPSNDDEGRPVLYPELPEPLPPSDARPAHAPELSDEQIERLAARLAPTVGPVQPALDLRDPGVLDLLAGGLYGRLRSRLRSELLADRERQGLLTEFH